MSKDKQLGGLPKGSIVPTHLYAPTFLVLDQLFYTPLWPLRFLFLFFLFVFAYSFVFVWCFISLLSIALDSGFRYNGCLWSPSNDITHVCQILSLFLLFKKKSRTDKSMLFSSTWRGAISSKTARTSCQELKNGKKLAQPLSHDQERPRATIIGCMACRHLRDCG